MKIKIIADLNIVPYCRPMVNTKTKTLYNPEKYTAFKKQLGMIAKAQMQGRKPIKGAFKFSADFFKVSNANVLNKKFGDVDNFVKSVLDALTGICYEDDAQCVELGTIRKFKSKNPKIIITIEEV